MLQLLLYTTHSRDTLFLSQIKRRQETQRQTPILTIKLQMTILIRFFDTSAITVTLLVKGLLVSLQLSTSGVRTDLRMKEAATTAVEG